MIKGVIFDRDWILIDSEWVNINAAIEAFEKFGIEITDEDKKHIVGTHPRDYLKYFQTKYDFDIEKFKQIQPDMYYALFDKATIFQDAIDLVKRIQGNLRLALNTWWDLEANQRLFKRAGLDDAFETVVTCEMYENFKPHPESYLIAMKKLWLQPHECVAIEDTDRWLASAKAAGAKCIVIPNEYTKNQDFSQADKIVTSAKEITIEMLKSLE